MNTTLAGIKHRSNEADNWISNVEDHEAENTQSEQPQQKTKIFYGTGEITSSVNNIYIIRAPEGKKGEQGVKNLFEEIMTKTFPNLVKEIDIQDQEAQRTPKKRKPKPRHSRIKKAKVKDKERFQKPRER